MKKLIIAGVLLSITYLTQAQVFIISDVHKHEIEVNEGHCFFSVFVEKTSQRLDSSTFYYWYKDGKINKNQGGYTGQLMHGEYLIYSRKGVLLEQGEYKLGRKEGKWKKWDYSGNLLEESKWRKGKKHGIYTQYINGEKVVCKYKRGILKRVFPSKHKNRIKNGKA
jgi:antitoxin component YwqK of YwqJK toxin-antitoxin module